jgi:hypothetical protein
MKQITLEEAEREFAASVAYYESRERGLGLRFREEVEAVVEWICRFPEAPRLRKKGYRRVNLRVATTGRGGPGCRKALGATRAAGAAWA